MAIESFLPLSIQPTQAVQQLSSGLKINQAADDPTGQAIVTALNSQINGQDMGYS